MSQYSNLSLKNYFSLLYLFPFLYVLGNAPTDILISSIAIISLINFFTDKEYYNEFKKLFFLFILFYLSILFSSLITQYNVYESFIRSFLIIRYFFFSIAVANFFSNKERLCLIIKLILVTIFFYYFTMTLQIFFDVNFIYNFNSSNQRLMAPFSDELISGTQIFILTNILIYFNKFYEIKITNKKLILITIFFLSLFFILRSGERMALFKYIFCMSIFIILYLKSFLKSFIIIFLSISLVVTIISLNKNLTDRFFIQFSEKFTSNYLDDNGSMGLSNFLNSGHGTLFTSAYNSFKNNYLFGVGSKQFRNDCKKNNSIGQTSFNKNIQLNSPCSTHPHNYFLEILSENGLIGFFFLSIFFVSVFFYHDITFKSKLFYSMPFLIFLWPITSTGSFFSNSNSIFWFCLGIYLIRQDYLIKIRN